jgi:hypothetical protein|tara:strand:- start:2316 stop:3329 length:1014 start_codon:yes stop_codon:yes gene_type:complete
MQTYIKPSELKSKLETLISINKPAFIWGASGIGKSEIISKVAEKLDYNLIDVRVSLLDPVDLRGVPSVENGVTKWNPPIFLPQENDKQSILFLDELPHGSPSVQNALFQLIRDRRIGEYKLPDSTIILAAGNRVSDRVGANKINGALANRFSHLHLEADVNDWVKWGMSEGSIDPNVIAFIRYRPELLFDFDKDSVAWASPRTWESVSDIVKADSKGMVVNSQDQSLIGGTVGDSVAIEFCAFMGMVNTLPDVSAIIKNPETYEVSDDPSVLYALTGALARRSDATNFDAIITYMTRDEMSNEFAVLCINDAITVNPKLAKTKAYVDFMGKYQHIMS